MCGSVVELQLDLVQSPNDPLVQLGPGQRHIVFQAVVDGEDQPYELWLGDTWMSECDGSPIESTRYAVFRQP